MDAIITTALVGTAQQNKIDITTGTPLDALTQKLEEGETERKLLLSVGAWAVYRQAGYVAESIPEIPEPTPPESLPACSRQVFSLLQDMFEGEHRALLPEALERLRNADLRLPHKLLPMALNVQPSELRSSVFPVLGERGRWLSQFNPDWSWVTQYLPGMKDTLLAGAEMLWQEGTLGQRTIILRLLHETDPAKARCWLEGVWKQEKAEARAQLLGTFEIGLSAEDEPFLEKALDDKAGGVRAAAALLLARMPASAFAQRMQARAAAMLSFSSGILTVTLPLEIGKDWQRDGIMNNAPSGVGKRVHWFKQVISLIHPGFWETLYGASADELVLAAHLDDQWRETLVEGWSKAAWMHSSTEWAMSLWDLWCRQQRENVDWSIYTSLLITMPPQEAERRVLDIFTDPKHPGKEDWEQPLSFLPHPWSKTFGEAYLGQLREYVSTLKFEKQGSPHYDSWYQSLEIAGVALPPDCFARAIEGFVIPDDSDTKAQWQKVQWQQALKNFVEAIRLRQRIVKEIV